MNDRRFKFGTIVTVLWLILIALIIFQDLKMARAMKPNEWADFFAGFFAPLAFLWLILGYLQQGQELQLSTEALRLQADELRNSVQQQKELVDVTRQQVESDREALQLERLARQDAAKPLFVVRNQGGSFIGDGRANYNLVISNAGNTVTSVVATLSGISGGPRILFDVNMFTRMTECTAELSTTEAFPDQGVNLRIEYLDTYGQAGVMLFQVLKQQAIANSMLSFIHVVV